VTDAFVQAGFERFQPGIPAEATIPWLVQRERSHLLKTIASIAGGILLTFAGLLFVASIFFVWHLEGDWWSPSAGFGSIFLWTALFVLPITFAAAGMGSGSFFEKALDGADARPYFGQSAWPELGFLLLDLANIGPTLVVFGLRRWWRRRSIGIVDRSVAARIVAMLLAADAAIPSAELIRLVGAEADKAIHLLVFLEIIDIGRTSRRVWLSGDARHELAALNPR
jgi:hypothetical protein